MPGSATTPGRPGTRAHAPVRIAFHLRNSVGTRDMNLCEAQWLAYVLPCRRFAVALTDDRARLGADAVRYSLIVSDLHRLLVAGLPAHCERFCTSSLFRSRLDWVIDLTHALVKLARAIDWRFLNAQFGSIYSYDPGCPPLPTQLMAGLALRRFSSTCTT